MTAEIPASLGQQTDRFLQSCSPYADYVDLDCSVDSAGSCVVEEHEVDHDLDEPHTVHYSAVRARYLAVGTQSLYFFVAVLVAAAAAALAPSALL